LRGEGWGGGERAEHPWTDQKLISFKSVDGVLDSFGASLEARSEK
jgi:hypothetical protein